MTPNTNKNPNLKFRHFWKGFDVQDNFITRLIATDLGNSPTVTVIESVFIPRIFRVLSRLIPSKVQRKLQNISKRANRYVWYTGENRRPPNSSFYDALISFDQDDFGGKNTYFPLFYSDLLLGGPELEKRLGCKITDPEKLVLGRNMNPIKKKFVAAFINNAEPTRMRAIEELSKYGKVDIFGKASGVLVESKLDVAKDYAYVLCFENDLYPGYITEKLLDAYLCGSVPLYWGLLGREPHINRKSFINATDFPTIESFAKFVGELDHAAYEQLLREPLLLSVPGLGPLKRAIYGTKFE